MPNRPPALAFFVASVVCAPVADAQAPVQLTTSTAQHQDALISPNGARVAFRSGTTSLGLIDIQSRTEVTLFTSATSSLGNFTWAPTNTGLYFANGSDVRFISNTGATSRSIGTVAGTNVDVWAVNDTESTIFGSRFDQATATSYIFRLASNGATAPVDIYSTLGTISKVRLDASNGFLLFERGQGTPFTPVDFVRIDIAGNNPTVLHTTSGTDNAGSPYWLDTGNNMTFSAVSPNNNRNQILAASTANPTTFYTDRSLVARRPFVARGGSWIAFEAQTPLGRRSIAIMDIAGGGVFFLSADHGLLGINGADLEGGLSMDRAGTRVVFNAEAIPGDPSPQSSMGELRDPIPVRAKLALGQQFTIEMPLAAGFIGAIGAADGFAATPVTLPGFSGQFDLDPATTATVLVGIGPGTATGTYTVPNNSALLGLFLNFQGVRLQTAASGSFTTWGYYQVL